MALFDDYYYLDYNKSSITYNLTAGQNYYIAVYCPDDETGQPYKYYNDYISEKPEYTLEIVNPEEQNVLNFSPVVGYTYIYDNNHESIRRENIVNISDSEVDGRSWIMTNRNLRPGHYIIFSSHNNETCYDHYYDPPNQELWGTGDEIYLDALLTSHNGATVTLNEAGYWTDVGNGESWSAIQAFSDYYMENIQEVELLCGEAFGFETEYKHNRVYQSINRQNQKVVIDFNNQNSNWLSSAIQEMYSYNYINLCEEGRPLFFIADITIEGNSN